ncbi:MAG: hypothetical protein JXA09_09545 [Anaerolineae bacterium]|nr:hypothetical protein [Anaerolineae bacterium]
MRWIERVVERLLDLPRRQWTVILTVLACINVLLYGAAGGLLYAYVLAPRAEPTAPLLLTSVPTLRPTFTPTWTSTPAPGSARTRVQTTPFPVVTSTSTATSAPLATAAPTATSAPTATAAPRATSPSLPTPALTPTLTSTLVLTATPTQAASAP